MVALAPNTSETSTWDVLDGFPKLHSRAREIKTRSCTEAPHSKSLDCVEIWLVIYESCDGLEFFTRDPMDYEGSEWNLYEFLGSRVLRFVDPSGQIPITCECRNGPRFGVNCALAGCLYYRTVECQGLASGCCREACCPNGGDSGGGCMTFTGSWKIVPGPDAYDDAEGDFDAAIAEIVICCIPIPAAKCAQVAWQGMRCTTRLVRVTRWGSPIKSGRWVMKGEPTWWNYVCSGKFQPPSWPGGNIPAGKALCWTAEVPLKNLRWPNEGGPLNPANIIKGCIG